MFVISFDVGIKNLAFVILKVDGTTYKIVHLDVVSIIHYKPPEIEGSPNVEHEQINVCQEDKCKSVPRYVNKQGTEYRCLKHTRERFVILPKGFKMKTLNTMNKEGLVCWIKEHKYKIDVSKLTSKTAITREICKHIYIPISKTKSKTTKCSQFSLISCSFILKMMLDEIHTRYTIPDIVLIENQISPKASRMKSIQTMITMYYIMRGVADTGIHYISSSRKLTLVPESFSVSDSNVLSKSSSISKGDTESKKDYEKRKKLGVQYTRVFIQIEHPTWVDMFTNHKKKDDLADCFLQGLWWLSHQNHIVLKEYKI